MLFSKTNEINAYEGDYRKVWCFNVLNLFSFWFISYLQVSRVHKKHLLLFLCSLLSNEYINEGKKISFLCVSIGAFCVISNTFWSITTSIRTIWLNARKWELIAICKIWYEFLKILQFMKFSTFKSSPKLCRYLSDSDDHILVQESDGNRFRFCKVFKEIFLSKLLRRRIISCL